ncbi:penicillin-binding protein 1A [Pseudomonadota bacterium]
MPDYKQLKAYDPPITTRLYTKDGRLLKEYAKEKRLYMPVEVVPEIVKNAFLAAEDSSFYSHPGVDFRALFSAIVYNVITYIRGGKDIRGGSTITQQVVKNFLLTKDKTIERKIKEAILSFRITKTFSKDKILELYLNQIYLGNRSYGVAAAALNYFNKAVDELTIEEAAILAALPKAPGKLDPRRNPEAAKARRDWVIERMMEDGHITKYEMYTAQQTGINIVDRGRDEVVNANYFAEAVRRQLVEKYGENVFLEDGYVVTTTIDPKLQVITDKYLKMGIETYDMRHGYRGSLGNIRNRSFDTEWYKLLEGFEVGAEYNPEWKKAVVLEVFEDKIDIGLSGQEITEENESEILEKINPESEYIEIMEDLIIQKGFIPLKHLAWARKYIGIDALGHEIKKAYHVGLRKGDVILVKSSEDIEDGYLLRQIPEVNGGAVVMDPHTGRILAIMGGYIDTETGFNRVTQAERQPGSILKTFAYLSALEQGMTPATIIMDEQIILDQGEGLPPYVPRNYSEKFYGPTTLRMGLEKSRNVTTVRMADEVGLNNVIEVIKRFGINKNPRKIYSIVLGSTESNLIKITRGYAMIINGGKKIETTIIEKIQDKNGKTIFRRDGRECKHCMLEKKIKKEKEIIFPEIPDTRETIVKSDTAYQITSLLEGVVKKGTGWKARAIGKPVGGKTGTTNNFVDAWFVGFTPDLVVGVYVGFDTPKTLGRNETGSSVAAPIFVNIMKDALKDKPSIPFRVPNNVKFVRIDKNTGYYPTPVANPRDIIFEVFKLDDDIEKSSTGFDIGGDEKVNFDSFDE